MEMKPVDSSNITEIGHDPSTKKLRVRFKNGGLYEYDDVPAEAHGAFVNAESVGSHFARHIRGGYLAHKVES